MVKREIFFSPTRVIKDPLKKIITGCMEMKTLSLLISFSETEEDKAFNFQAFKGIVSSINASQD